ncbi:hypothetical protein B0H14DRAFT_3148437 [Mycena olivaceomarginata]|nr:hypothetical protein B0H14DRAFT_3148437 [Mycena olivaceomarginata]
MDDDSDEEDDEDMRRTRTSSVPASPSKHAALAAATGAKSPSSKGPYVPERLETPPPQYKQQPAARIRDLPVAALDQSVNGNLARPAPTAAPQGRAPPSGGHPNLRIAPPLVPRLPLRQRHALALGLPAPAAAPHHAHHARLRAPAAHQHHGLGRLRRLSPRPRASSCAARARRRSSRAARGQKGDQFWRRFSMVAKDPQEKRPSTWLTKAQGGAAGLSRWVWIVGIVLLHLRGGRHRARRVHVRAGVGALPPRCGGRERERGRGVAVGDRGGGEDREGRDWRDQHAPCDADEYGCAARAACAGYARGGARRAESAQRRAA